MRHTSRIPPRLIFQTIPGSRLAMKPPCNIQRPNSEPISRTWGNNAILYVYYIPLFYQTHIPFKRSCYVQNHQKFKYSINSIHLDSILSKTLNRHTHTCSVESYEIHNQYSISNDFFLHLSRRSRG